MGFIRLNKTQIIDGLGEALSFTLHGLLTALPLATAQATEKFTGATVPELFLVIGFPAKYDGVTVPKFLPRLCASPLRRAGLPVR